MTISRSQDYIVAKEIKNTYIHSFILKVCDASVYNLQHKNPKTKKRE